ncbi:hypothetical protein PILCRDRAFT_531388 [Piloderma croceum F 1598]|uniref:Uncharacterized protein n=1 Tax=Piloderma croceum (strain F 1598) TaxID=765440 RepID=A0A0C3FKC0_PILCF|nr:hypothetical protein PILCRDRAFT_531388 [Piloderma croceum F 1598]
MMHKDVHGNEIFQVVSVLNEVGRKHVFSKEFSPFYGPLVGLANITRDYAMEKEVAIDKDAYIFRPLKQQWSRMIRRLWDHPARSLGPRNMFSKERYLVPYIFCRITEVENSFASVIDEDSDLTIPLITRYWVHATEEEEIMQSSIFMILLIPRRPDPVSLPGNSLSPLYIIAEGEPDTTVTILRRVLLNNDAIVEFVHATASHLRRFSGIEAETVAAIMEKYWSWARANRNDPLCFEFLRVIRTSDLLWRSLFEASSRSMGNRYIGSFHDTPHFYMSNLARCLAVNRDSTPEAVALTELWISTGIFDALEASLVDVLSRGTEDEQVELCTNLTRIYFALSFGPEKSPTIKSLIIQQLRRPRTVRLLWDRSFQAVWPRKSQQVMFVESQLQDWNWHMRPVRANVEVARRHLPQDVLSVNQDTVHSDAKNATGRTTNWFVG